MLYVCKKFIKPKVMDEIKIDVAQLERAASKLRAISHPMRIAIIDLLTERDKMNVTEIYTKLKIEQATASHHLNILKSKGVLGSKRDGKMIFYFLQTEILAEIIECINRCDEI